MQKASKQKNSGVKVASTMLKASNGAWCNILPEAVAGVLSPLQGSSMEASLPTEAWRTARS